MERRLAELRTAKYWEDIPMKRIDLALLASAWCAFGALLAGGTAGAEEFPQTTAAAQRLVTEGFKQSSLPLLRREATGSPAAVRASLLEKLCPTPCSSQSTISLGNTLRVTGDHWSLEIKGDADSARFQDLQVAGRAHSLAKPLAQKMSAAELEKAGRAFIAAKLGSVIVLEPGEGLVPVRTDYRIEGGQDIKTREITRSVVANRIVFGRTVDGVPVVGGGSTVVVTFANDRSVESFAYDWPKYHKANLQAVVDTGEILHRVQKVIGVRTGVSAPTFPVRVPKTSGTAFPIPLTTDTMLQKLECGYYDPGVGARDPSAAVQPGCVYHAVFQGQHGIRQGYAGTVPAGAQFEPNAAWVETQILNQATPPSAADKK
jgi:hypothetical protein